MLPVIWAACGLSVVIAAARSRLHPTALRFGRVAVGVLFLGAGAAVNAFLLVRGDDYAKFADGSYIAFVRHTWRSLVVPNHHVFISVLIAFEAAVGLLAVSGGRWTQLAYRAAIAFHVALLSFGWGFYVWSVPMITAITALLRRERTQIDGHLVTDIRAGPDRGAIAQL